MAIAGTENSSVAIELPRLPLGSWSRISAVLELPSLVGTSFPGSGTY